MSFFLHFFGGSTPSKGPGKELRALLDTPNPAAPPSLSCPSNHPRFSAGVTPKSGHSPILKCPTDFPLILWHPYARHYYFCVMTGKEQEKWRAVFQDSVRHCNNGE